MTGIEPVTSSLPRTRSTPELHRLIPRSSLGALWKNERETRFELATLSLEGWCSTNWATPAFFLWWGEQDSNLRRRSHQIYSLTSLTAWVSPQPYQLFSKNEPMEGFEPPTRWLQISCSGQLSYIGFCSTFLYSCGFQRFWHLKPPRKRTANVIFSNTYNKKIQLEIASSWIFSTNFCLAVRYRLWHSLFFLLFQLSS